MNHGNKSKRQRSRRWSLSWILSSASIAVGFELASQSPLSRRLRVRMQSFPFPTPADEESYQTLHEKVVSITHILWNGESPPMHKESPPMIEGEASLPSDIPFDQRQEYFRSRALDGCPYAQHSYGLLLWSGFGSTERDAGASARFHAAAASQHHLDGMAVLGGCLRTGTGIPKKGTIPQKRELVSLGLKLIDFCASMGNPSGMNKKAALLETNGNDREAFELYEASIKSGRSNALIKFNLGWSLIHDDYSKDVDRGRTLWKEATEMAPDEGSEEAAWHLYQEYVRDDPNHAKPWYDLAESLGYNDDL